MREKLNPNDKELRSAACLLILLVLIVDLFMNHAMKWVFGKTNSRST